MPQNAIYFIIVSYLFKQYTFKITCKNLNTNLVIYRLNKSHAMCTLLVFYVKYQQWSSEYTWKSVVVKNYRKRLPTRIYGCTPIKNLNIIEFGATSVKLLKPNFLVPRQRNGCTRIILYTHFHFGAYTRSVRKVSNHFEYLENR